MKTKLFKKTKRSDKNIILLKIYLSKNATDNGKNNK